LISAGKLFHSLQPLNLIDQSVHYHRANMIRWYLFNDL